ncbi:hypothetical protein AAMO2058_000085100 [Amorphochlora amoebiformis]
MVTAVVSKKFAEEAVARLERFLPRRAIHIQHLKRARDLGGSGEFVELLIGRYEDLHDISNPISRNISTFHLTNILSVPILRVGSCSLLAHPPTTREHWDTSSKMWPHVPSRRPCSMPSEHLSGEEIRDMQVVMSTLDEMAGGDRCLNAGVLVDIERRLVVAAAVGDVSLGENATVCPMNHAAVNLIRQLASKNLNASLGRQVLKSPYYLCTGLHCYLLKEPCHMCAMALVHARVTRVVIRDLKENGSLSCSMRGGKGPVEALHGLGVLNHRFEVFWVGKKGVGSLTAGWLGSCKRIIRDSS